MSVKELTRDQVLEVIAKGAASISEVARGVRLCKGKLDGKTSKKLRSIVPELDGLLKANKGMITPPASTECPETADEENPYGRGLYRELFRQGAKRFQKKSDLIVAVAASTGKTITCVGYAYAVLSSRQGKHSSNNGKSTALVEGDKIKLIALKRTD